jgi:hypothetical protein
VRIKIVPASAALPGVIHLLIFGDRFAQQERIVILDQRAVPQAMRIATYESDADFFSSFFFHNSSSTWFTEKIMATKVHNTDLV